MVESVVVSRDQYSDRSITMTIAWHSLLVKLYNVTTTVPWAITVARKAPNSEESSNTHPAMLKPCCESSLKENQDSGDQNIYQQHPQGRGE